MITGIPPRLEGPPVFGMNTVDDPKALRAGECVELVNARPGNPPEIRKGCNVRLLPDTENYTLCPPAWVFTDEDGNNRILFWVKEDESYKLVSVDDKGADFTVLGTATGLSSPNFSAVVLQNLVYVFAGQSFNWNGSYETSRGKILDLNGSAAPREHCIQIAPVVTSVTETGNGRLQTGYYGYGFTYVRREDLSDSNGKYSASTTYLPGESEGYEDQDNRLAVQITGTGKKVLVDTTINDYDDYFSAVEQGATHVRVYRTFLQSTEADALAATMYFVADVPLVRTYLKITDITLDKNPILVTTDAAHGLSNGATVEIIDLTGASELDEQSFVVADKTDDTFRLTGTDPGATSEYESGGVVIQDEIDITGITVPDGSIDVTVDTACGVAVGEYILIESVTGYTGINGSFLPVIERNLGQTEMTVFCPVADPTAYSSGGTVKRFASLFGKTTSYSEDSSGYLNIVVRNGAVVVAGDKAAFGYKVGTEESGSMTGRDFEITAVSRVESTYITGYNTAGYPIYASETYDYIATDILFSEFSALSTAEANEYFLAMRIHKQQIVGATETWNITGITQPADKIEITTDGAHGFSDGEYAYFRSITGSTQLNGNSYEIVDASGSTFKIKRANVQEVADYVSGGSASKFIANVDDIFLCYPELEVGEHDFAEDDYVAVGDVIGSTELNGNTYRIGIASSTSIYLKDTDSNDITAYIYGGSVVSGGAGYTDNNTDAELEAVGVTLSATNYGPAPIANFAAVVKNRMWLFGISGSQGTAYYSEAPGEDGGTPINLAMAFPEKYYSWWKAAYSVKCSVGAGGNASGIKNISDDIFFFFEEQIFALFGGDPNYGTPQNVSPDIGCPFPQTICNANIPYFGGLCILFLSNRGPAVLKAGGEIRLMHEFAIADLWPGTGDIFAELRVSDSNKEYLQLNTNAMFWKDTFTVAYKTVAGVNKIYECYFDPAAAETGSEPMGSSEIEFARI